MHKQKIVIYQLLPRLFGNTCKTPVPNGSREENGCGKLKDISDKALLEIKRLGVNTIWYTGIIEHAITMGYPKYDIPDGNALVIKGKAGSPYAIKDYYDVNPDLAIDVAHRMDEFQDLIDRTHQQGMKAIIDFVPNHLAREYFSDAKPNGVTDFGTDDKTDLSFNRNNNFYYLPQQELQLPPEIQSRFPDLKYHEYPAKATGNDQFTAQPNDNDWYETVKLNYGVNYENHTQHFDPTPDSWLKMKDILLYWAAKGIDGFRCDMAEMVPVEFWEWIIPVIKQKFPTIIFLAEVYNPNLYESYIRKGKFDYLYDKVGLYDTLRAIIRNEAPAQNISHCWQSLNGLDEHMLRFLENHDEQRIASRFFANDPKKAIPAMYITALLHRSPVMIYFGQEVGEAAIGASGFSGDDGRTTIFDYWNVPEHQKWMNEGRYDGEKLSLEQKNLRETYGNILQISQQPAISKGEFYDLMYANVNAPFFNSDKIYAFARHCPEQKLMIVCNFDSQDAFPHVKVPSHAIEMMDIPRPIKILFKELNSSQNFSIGSEELIEQGIKLCVKAYDCLVLQIEY